MGDFKDDLCTKGNPFDSKEADIDIFFFLVAINNVLRDTDEEEEKDDDELIDAVSQNVLGHGAGDERLVASVRLPPEQGLRGRLGGQGQRGERVHDQVDPKHLHGFQRGVLSSATCT